ncbi:unnamed protein product [Prorocentrum cordatum]|uniref:Macro domain-containing protein n=1 Tax=Prorocentrum cordatum TaxID=2364126 RepID=A0ABN9S7A4_9DINO|nr:unnamed protein product [Polarella glacialis]
MLPAPSGLRMRWRINAVDVFLRRVNAAILEAGLQGQKLGVTNGYLTMPTPKSAEAAALILEACRAHAHTLRPLVMTGVPACGLRPDKGAFSSCTHSTHLFYASAVPINRYTNGIGVVCKAFGDEDVQKFQLHVAEVVLVAQYYGALQIAACRAAAAGRKAKVFLMPLGGGVFNNPWEVIVKAMALAAELLAEEEHSRLDIKALAFHRGTSRRTEDVPERVMLTQLLRRHRKLAGGGCET